MKRQKSSSSAGLRLGFRSGLEERNAKLLESLGLTVAYESLKLKYEVPAMIRSYTPDFPLPNGIIIETKGVFDPTDRAKHLLIKAQHPLLDIRFVFSNSNAKLRKNSKTTNADWCRKYGYQFADKLVPVEWTKEPAKKVQFGFPEARKCRGCKKPIDGLRQAFTPWCSMKCREAAL